MGTVHPHERDDLEMVPDPSDPANQPQPPELVEPREEVTFPLMPPSQDTSAPHGVMEFFDADSQGIVQNHSDDPPPSTNPPPEPTPEPQPSFSLETAVFQPLAPSYGSLRIHHHTSDQLEQAVEQTEQTLNHAFQHATVGDRIEHEYERLTGSVAFTNVIKIPKGKRYADELVHKIALQMIAQAEGDATARAVNYLSSAELVKQFLQNTTEGFQVILAILRDCNIRVPLEISFDPKTRQLDRRYLDFTDGDEYSIDEIIKGLIYLNMTFGPTSRRVTEVEALNRRTNELNASLMRQQEAMAEEYEAMQKEVIRLRRIEALHNQMVIEPLRETERQFIIFRAYEIEAKPTRRQRRERKSIERINREFIRDVSNERLRQSAVLPRVDVMALEHEPNRVRRGSWIGLTDPDERRRAETNELESSRYEAVSNIGEALKLTSYEEAQAILDRLNGDRKEAKKKGRKSLYKGPKNPHRYAVFQIVMRKV